MITGQRVLPPTHQEVSEKVVGLLAVSFEIDPSEVNTSQPLVDYGLDSLEAMVIAADMEEWLEVELPSTLLWDLKNVDEVVAYVIDNFSALARGEEVMAI